MLRAPISNNNSFSARNVSRNKTCRDFSSHYNSKIKICSYVSLKKMLIKKYIYYHGPIIQNWKPKPYLKHSSFSIQCQVYRVSGGVLATTRLSSNCNSVHNIDVIMGGRDGGTNHQPHDCLLNHLSRRRSNKTSKLRVTGLCAGNSPVTGEFPAQRAGNAENVFIWWRDNVLKRSFSVRCIYSPNTSLQQWIQI